MSSCIPAPQLHRPATSPHPRDLGVIVVAAGSGERFGRPEGKALVPVAGRPLVAWSLLAADSAPSVAEIVVVTRARDLEEVERLANGLPLVSPVTVVAGGATRQESVRRGLAVLDRRLSLVAVDLEEVERLANGLPLVSPVTVVAGGATRQESVRRGLAVLDRRLSLVAVHDGARPLVTSEAFERLAARLRSDLGLAGLVAGCPSVDTLKVVGAGGQIVRTPDRSKYWCVQTPQAFRSEDLRRAHGSAAAEGFEGTDDASLVERFGLKVAVAQVLRANGKLTYPEDLVPIEAQLEAREREERPLA